VRDRTSDRMAEVGAWHCVPDLKIMVEGRCNYP
jgi:hypothetical protein